MSGMMHKIADAITGHHTTNTNTGTTTGAHTATPNHPTTGSNYSSNSGALNSAQVRDTGLNNNATTGLNNATTGSQSQHTSAYDSYQNAPNSLTSASSSTLGSNTAGSTFGRDRNLHSSSTTAPASSSIAARQPQATTDDAMTLSEEHLLVNKEQVPAGKVALNKYVTTEKVGTAVPIVKEHAVVEREPITEANRAAALRGPDFKEAHHEVQLMEERVVTQKEEVPIERVRLRKEQEQTEQYVEAELRKEHVNVDNGLGAAGDKQYQAEGVGTSGTSATTGRQAALDSTSGQTRRHL